jgi:hypothetical protein
MATIKIESEEPRPKAGASSSFPMAGTSTVPAMVLWGKLMAR